METLVGTGGYMRPPLVGSGSVLETPPISWFPVVDRADWPSDIERLATRLETEVGFVPNLLRAWVWRPDRLRAWYVHYRQLLEATDALSLAEREMVAVVVSSTNRCAYCLASHGAGLRRALGDPALADQIAVDHRQANLDIRTVAILDFAVALTLHPGSPNPSDVRALGDLGLSPHEVWDVIELTAMINLTNRLSAAAGVRPNAE
jgi:uncharacterized peroxidase-related enzyme